MIGFLKQPPDPPWRLEWEWGPSEEVKGTSRQEPKAAQSSGQGNGQQWVDVGGFLEVEASHPENRWVWGEESVQRTPGFLPEGPDGWSCHFQKYKGKAGG